VCLVLTWMGQTLFVFFPLPPFTLNGCVDDKELFGVQIFLDHKKCKTVIGQNMTIKSMQFKSLCWWKGVFWCPKFFGACNTLNCNWTEYGNQKYAVERMLQKMSNWAIVRCFKIMQDIFFGPRYYNFVFFLWVLSFCAALIWVAALN
jgi:hypothetical protein